jgi:DNA-binding MarR family transcriptional regulator
VSSEFDAKVDSVGRLVQGYQSAVDDFDREMARILGVNSTDLRCLEALVTEPEAEFTPRVIADRLNLTTGSVTTMLDRLERAGYVTRERHTRDRRKVIVRATPEVIQRSWTMIGPMLEDGHTDVTAHFTAEELGVVERFLDRATQLQKKHVQRLKESDPLVGDR